MECHLPIDLSASDLSAANAETMRVMAKIYAQRKGHVHWAAAYNQRGLIHCSNRNFEAAVVGYCSTTYAVVFCMIH
jgi:hypothetical protein